MTALQLRSQLFVRSQRSLQVEAVAGWVVFALTLAVAALFVTQALAFAQGLLGQ